jgi:hypothetical protein
VASDWFENDDLFRELLAVGHRWAGVVAAYLRNAGLDVEITPMEWRKTIEHRGEFADEYDLSVIGARVPIHVDVKSRALGFTTPEDYPYPTAFVDTVSGWDAKAHKPSAIVLVSQLTGAMLVIPRTSADKWTRAWSRDHVRGIDDWFYMIDRSLLRPMDVFVEWLLAQTSVRH